MRVSVRVCQCCTRTGCSSTVPSGKTISAGSTLQTGNQWKGRGEERRGGEGWGGEVQYICMYVHQNIFKL